MPLEDNLDYKKCLLELKKYHPESLRYANYLGTSNSDKIYPKQNNMQIALSIKIYENLENFKKNK
jgi:hypothetical protein